MDSGHLMELVCNDSHRLITSSNWYVPFVIRQLLFVASMISWLLYFIGWKVIPGVLFVLAVGVTRVVLLEYDYKLGVRVSQLSGNVLATFERR